MTDGADLLDHADALVAEDRARLHPGHGAADHVQVGPADGAGREPDDRVGRLLDLRLGDVVEADVADPVEHDGLHRDVTLGEERTRSLVSCCAGCLPLAALEREKVAKGVPLASWQLSHCLDVLWRPTVLMARWNEAHDG